MNTTSRALIALLTALNVLTMVRLIGEHEHAQYWERAATDWREAYTSMEKVSERWEKNAKDALAAGNHCADVLEEVASR